MDGSLREELRSRSRAGVALLAGVDPAKTPKTSKARAKKTAADDAQRLEAWQERLTAENTRSVLVVLQGMDTSGKDGTIKHVISAMNPQGCLVVAFKQPTEDELAHDFLWRIRKSLPEPGQVCVFNRSHYEDVLIVRVHGLVPEEVWRGRYEAINDFEAEVASSGTTIVKLFLHISRREQARRLIARLDDPTKRWKFNPADIAERDRWDDYQAAYDDALTKCSTDVAPWYIVPADHKWYRNWAVTKILLETFEELSPAYPQPDLDIRALERRIEEDTE